MNNQSIFKYFQIGRRVFIPSILAILCIIICSSCDDIAKNPIFSAMTTQSVAFTFAVTVEETRYQDIIKSSGNSGAVDSMAPLIFEPKTTIEHMEGIVYGDGDYTMTIDDLTSGEALDRLEHQPTDTSKRVRKTVISNDAISLYNASDVHVGSTTSLSMQTKFKTLIDKILGDSALLAACDQGMLAGSITNSPSLSPILEHVQQAGGTIKNKGNGLIEISMAMPTLLPDGTHNSISNGTILYLADTVQRKVLAYGIMSGTQAISFTSYFYNQNLLKSECTEIYSTLPDGTEMKSVSIKKYHTLTINCLLNN
ncbi:MAG: hypothetical protein IPM69_11070 [Ignavibacteria bacterium]|nr:hypothetical protein [Ignavibacteria bacterium]